MERDDDSRLAIIAEEEPRLGLHGRSSGLAGVADLTSPPHQQNESHQRAERPTAFPVRKMETSQLIRGDV